MKVEELIKRLQELPKDFEILMDFDGESVEIEDVVEMEENREVILCSENTDLDE